MPIVSKIVPSFQTSKAWDPDRGNHLQGSHFQCRGEAAGHPRFPVRKLTKSFTILVAPRPWMQWMQESRIWRMDCTIFYRKFMYQWVNDGEFHLIFHMLTRCSPAYDEIPRLRHFFYPICAVCCPPSWPFATAGMKNRQGSRACPAEPRGLDVAEDIESRKIGQCHQVYIAKSSWMLVVRHLHGPGAAVPTASS